MCLDRVVALSGIGRDWREPWETLGAWRTLYGARTIRVLSELRRYQPRIPRDRLKSTPFLCHQKSPPRALARSSALVRPAGICKEPERIT